MNMKKINPAWPLIVALLMLGASAHAEVTERQVNSLTRMMLVSNDAWQPKGFKNGISIPAAYLTSPDITIDGKDDESAWNQARGVRVPLAYGDVKSADLKAVYTDKEVFIRVRWADDDEDRLHRPWIWSASQNRYVEGRQVEDSLLLSFEAGCEWTPSLLGGYIFDFDGWHWLAARTDPFGHALDVMGSVQDRDTVNNNYKRYTSRITKDDWHMKFTDRTEDNLHKGWSQLDRIYTLQPVTKTLYVSGQPDGTLGRTNGPHFYEKIAAPAETPYPHEESRMFPQYRPVKLTGDMADVRARGKWEDGHWTVEFRRDLILPARHFTDIKFTRLTQFSVHIFDHTERVDEASESGRLFLEFLEDDQYSVRNAVAVD
jgi:hypothetical protein